MREVESGCPVELPRGSDPSPQDTHVLYSLGWPQQWQATTCAGWAETNRISHTSRVGKETGQTLERRFSTAREIGQSIKCLLYKYEDLNLILRIHVESWVLGHTFVIPALGKQEQAGALWLLGQPVQPNGGSEPVGSDSFAKPPTYLHFNS